MNLRIHTLWKQWDDDSLTLLFALDEPTVEDSWDVWQEGCKAACARYGILLTDAREAIVSLDANPIHAVFEPAETTGIVRSEP